MNKKWFRHLNILAAVLIGIGGIGLNTIDETPARFYYGILLATGVVVFAIFFIGKMRERQEDMYR